jgi:hypothetical protein
MVTPFSIQFAFSTFGNTGTTTPVRLVTVKNTTGSPILIGTITTATLTGPSPGANFQIASDTCTGVNLAAGATCQVGLTFTATGVGAYTGSATIPSASPSSPQTVNLSGTGLQASINLPASQVFANTVVGGTSPTKTATFTNPNSVGLTISGFTVSGDFAIVTDGCSGVLAANSSCTVTLTFDPTVSGAETGGLTITSNAKNSPATVTLKGTGTLSAPTLIPASLAFGNVMHGTTSPDKFITVTNNNVATAGGTITISGITTANPVYAIDGGSTTCTSTLAGGGATCTIAVNFSPTTTGSMSSSLSVMDNAGTGTQKASLFGTGN